MYLKAQIKRYENQAERGSQVTGERKKRGGGRSDYRLISKIETLSLKTISTCIPAD